MLPHPQQQHLQPRTSPRVTRPAPPRPDPVGPASTSTSTSTSTRPVASLAGEDKLCWICYESSDEAPDRPFVHACSCTLLAHPDCLLEWIATRPPSSSSTSSSSSAPRCPVCATLIIVKEDKSKYLKLYRSLSRSLDRLSLAATVAGVAAGAWLVASAYGLWAVRTFMGDRVTRALLERNTRGFPFRLWLNLPLIPFALVLSRTPLIDSLLPFLPLTLALSTSSPSTTAFPTSFASIDPLGLDDLTLRYPPSPTLTICLLPWFRILYCRARHKVFRAVLGRQKRFSGIAGMMEEAARDEQAAWEVLDQEESDSDEMIDDVGEGHQGRSRDAREGVTTTTRRTRATRPRHAVELVAEVEVEVEVEEQAAANDHPLDGDVGPRNDLRAREEEAVERGQAGTEVDAGRAPPPLPPLPPSSLRIGLGRFTSLLVGALIYPALASLVGSALFVIATRGIATRSGGSTRPGDDAPVAIRVLRRVLGISSLVAAASGSGVTSSRPRLSFSLLHPIRTISSLVASLSSLPTSFSSSPSTSSSSSSSLFLNPFSSTSSSSSFSFPSSTTTTNPRLVDPVWIRNSLGGLIVLLIRDAFELSAGILEIKRKKSRKVVERPIGPGGGSWGTSTTKEATTTTTTTTTTTPTGSRNGSAGHLDRRSNEGEDNESATRWSGGTDPTTGREAVVNNFL
ncbi:hypothetical protein JCM10212_005339 [Sporobolomyces blumeae]